jgi:hypothetical protein
MEGAVQRLLLALGSAAILAISFFGTLYFIDSSEFQSLDSVRTEHAKLLKTALEKYRAVNGKYPVRAVVVDIADLRPELVGGGFISSLPVDPYWKNGRVNQYRYRSEGTTYGLLLQLELGPCQTGEGPAATDEWDHHKVISCPF